MVQHCVTGVTTVTGVELFKSVNMGGWMLLVGGGGGDELTCLIIVVQAANLTSWDKRSRIIIS